MTKPPIQKIDFAYLSGETNGNDILIGNKLNEVIERFNNRTIQSITPDQETELKELLKPILMSGSRKEPYITNVVRRIVDIFGE